LPLTYACFIVKLRQSKHIFYNTPYHGRPRKREIMAFFRPFRALSRCVILPGVRYAHPWLLSFAASRLENAANPQLGKVTGYSIRFNRRRHLPPATILGPSEARNCPQC